MRPELNGLLDGLTFIGRLLMPTRAWILTLISLVTRRWKSPFPSTFLESQTPWLIPAPLPRLLLPLLTSDILHVAFLVYFFYFFFYVGLWTPDISDVVLNEYSIFYPFASFCCLANLSCLVSRLLRLLT